MTDIEVLPQKGKRSRLSALNEDREPWARQRGETRHAHAAFLRYRDQGPTRGRSRVAEELNVTPQVVGRWALANLWEERADAWDRELDRLTAESSARNVAVARNELTEAARRGARALQAQFEKLEGTDRLRSPTELANLAKALRDVLPAQEQAGDFERLVLERRTVRSTRD